ncbi:FAD-binding protein [Telluribacter humicola]|uniref:FAD-binding protein n=1 Tax=Telluribacter humicola TaxID=1720261 RepID=UPI001A95ABF5|nr:FAD-binding protein [Telluribacter humicola]
MTLKTVKAALEAGINGTVCDLIPDSHQTDFGGLRRKQPLIRVSARSEQDVLHTFRVAREASLPVTIRGAAHSCNGQSLNEGGILLENFSSGAEVEFVAPDLVTLTGRSRWRAVEQELNAAGRQTPVLTDYLDMSVGGTLSVGGIGLNSVRNGFQVDTIRRLRLIQFDGTALWCSPEENPELFRFALAGLGQMGLIEKVVMQTEPFRRYAHVIKRQHNSIGDMMAFLPQAAADGNGVTHYNGYIRPHQIVSEYGYFSNEAQADLTQLAPWLHGASDEVFSQDNFPFWVQERRDLWLGAFPNHLRIWTDYKFGYEGLVQFMQWLEPQLSRAPFSQVLKGMYVLICKRPTPRTHFAFLPAPAGEQLYGVGLYSMVNRWSPALIAQTLIALKQTLRRCAEFGGRPYLYGHNDLDATLKQQFYGADYQRLLALRDELAHELLNAESF